MKSNYVYNITKIYKNNYPVNIDIDLICDKLYTIAGDRPSFSELMNKIEQDIMTSDDAKKIKKNSYHNNYNPLNIIDKGKNKIHFKTTLPEGELIKEPFYKSNILHKKFTDTNANSKFYFPSNNQDILKDESNYKTQWTNRANKILIENENLPGNELVVQKVRNNL